MTKVFSKKKNLGQEELASIGTKYAEVMSSCALLSFLKKILELLGTQFPWLKWLLGEPVFHCSQLQATSLSWCSTVSAELLALPFASFCFSASTSQEAHQGDRAAFPPSFSELTNLLLQQDGVTFQRERGRQSHLQYKHTGCWWMELGSERRMIYGHKLSQYK